MLEVAALHTALVGSGRGATPIITFNAEIDRIRTGCVQWPGWLKLLGGRLAIAALHLLESPPGRLRRPTFHRCSPLGCCLQVLPPAVLPCHWQNRPELYPQVYNCILREG
jgi:hypothetical protein